MTLYNTLTRKKEEFITEHGEGVSLYSCGPTVYDFAHIGHFRAYVFVDVLVRSLCLNGYTVHHVMNITDVGHLTDDADQGEDKMERKAQREKRSVWDIAKQYTDDFFVALEALNVQKPETVCKATENIAEMIALIQNIEKNGYTYQTSDGIYFDTSKLKDYGKLALLNIEQLQEGARVEKNPEKRNPTDFTLWKFSQKGVKRQMEWNSPWGVGFPGWHIECTAMGVKYLGESIDIHTGGIDHIPVHHTNEIAQAQGAYGRDIVRVWMHNEFVLVDGEKMSKSKKNFYTMADIVSSGFNPLAVRYFFLLAHYRTQVNFTFEALQAAQNALENLYEKLRHLKHEGTTGDKTHPQKEAGYLHDFLVALNDDLNTAKALSVLWEVVKDESISPQERVAFVHYADAVFGLDMHKVVPHEESPLPHDIDLLAKEREEARKKRNFVRADELRKEIERQGYVVRDTHEGQSIHAE